MNTLFRVLYTVVIQWRTYMMVCGLEEGWGCVSLMDREMVSNPDKTQKVSFSEIFKQTGLRLDDWADPAYSSRQLIFLRPHINPQVSMISTRDKK